MNFKDNSRRVTSRITDVIEKNAHRAGLYSVRLCKGSMKKDSSVRHKTKGLKGRDRIEVFYSIGSSAREAVKLTPNAPFTGGNQPGVLTGNLRASIDYAVDRSVSAIKVYLGVRKGIALAQGKTPASKYALALEFGTNRMKPKSFLRATILNHGTDISRVLVKGIRK